MKATLELPDELFKAMKIRAASEGRKLMDVIAEVVRWGLSESSPGEGACKAVQLPLIHCPIVAPDTELGPEQIAAILTVQEANITNEAARR